MSKNRSQDDDDEPIDSDNESHVEDEVEIAPARRFRPQELMFGTAGRLALGVFGVLILLGGAAIVNQMINRKPAPDAAKSTASTKKKSQQEVTSPASEEPSENLAANSGAVTPASATKRAYEPYVPPDYAAPAPAETEEYAVDSPEAAADASTVVAAEVEADDKEDSYVANPSVADVAQEAEPAVAPAAAPPRKAPGPLTDTATATPIQPPTRVYVVGKNESLFDVARHEFHDAARWAEIYQLNAAAIGDHLAELPAGTKLRVPQR